MDGEPGDQIFTEHPGVDEQLVLEVGRQHVAKVEVDGQLLETMPQAHLLKVLEIIFSN
ncbi:hypothetical protein D9M68_961000 [compost metagenome]